MLNLGLGKAGNMITKSMETHQQAFRKELHRLSQEGAENSLEQASAFYLQKITEDLSLYFMNSDFRQMNMFGILMSSPISQGFNFDPAHLTAEQLFAIAHFILTSERPKPKSMEKVKEMFQQIIEDTAKEIL